VLCDADKRAAYDRFGHAGLGAQGFGGGPFAGGVDLGDIFGDLFGEMFSVGGMGGGASRGSRQQRGDDLRFDLTIDFENAVFGIEKEVKIRRLETCTVCGGKGSASGRGPSICTHCQGRGQLRYQQGFFSVARTCVACSGTGTVISDPCTGCRGEGRKAAEIKMTVKVPPGVEEGTRIRYGGEGDVGRVGGPRGDLYVILSVRAHDYFERKGYDLYCVLPISFPQAAMGDDFEIPGIDGAVSIKIPEGTQSGKELRIRGRGVPYLNERGKGDLIVKVVVQIPRKLNRAQRDLVAKLAESMAVDNKPTSPGLLEKMKDLFS
jgi:molecular chaperone DnaJ